MAWAISQTGGGEHLLSGEWRGLDESFTIIHDLHELSDNPASTDVILDVGGTSLGVSIQLRLLGALRVYVSSSFIEIDVSSLIGLPVKIQLDYDENTLNTDVYINNTLSGSFTTTRTTRYVAGRSLGIGATYTGTLFGIIKTKSLSLVSPSGLYDRYYDATASDHSNGGGAAPYPQPILIDTIGGNNAAGVDFSTTDLDYWVNLGGGPVGVIQQIMNSYRQRRI